MITGSRWLAGAGVGCLVLLAGCKTAEDFKNERYGGVSNTINTIDERVALPAGKELKLDECKKFALENNLDVRVMALAQDVADSKVRAQMLEMLPEVNIKDDFTARSSYAASSSEGVNGGTTGSTGYTRSSDKDENRFNIELAFSVLDFGLAFLNAEQAQGRALIAEEQKRRAIQNLQLDVTRAYFRVAATQDAIDSTRELLDSCKDNMKLVQELVSSGTINPVRGAEEQRRLMQLQNMLLDCQRNYEDACYELTALMGVRPTANIRVDTTILNQLIELQVPDVADLEKIALVERPELYTLDVQTHITATEAHKTVLMMFPQVNWTANMINSNNPFLMNETWMEMGIKAAYNLMKLPQQVAYLRSIQKEVDENAMRTLALSVGVMSQVRIAYANLLDLQNRYQQNADYYESFKTLLDMTERLNEVATAGSRLEIDRLRIETAQARIDKLLMLGNYYVGYARLLNAVGIDDFRPDTVSEIMNEIQLAEARDKAQEDSRRLMAASLEFQDNVETYNGVPLNSNSMTEEKRQSYEALLPPVAANESQPTM